jgi:DMSO/TMAO reductase YedYZ heme-binding membrane subunit
MICHYYLCPKKANVHQIIYLFIIIIIIILKMT